MENQQCTEMPVKRFPELSAQWTLEQVSADPFCKIYVPDKWFTDGAKVCRKYLWKVLAYVRTEFVREILYHAYQSRVDEVQKAQDEEPIDVCEEMMNLIQTVPFLSSKLFTVIVDKFVDREKGQDHETCREAEVEEPNKKARKVTVVTTMTEFNKKRRADRAAATQNAAPVQIEVGNKTFNTGK